MARDKYLEHEVLSAPPQKLQLMLIEAALRQGFRAKHLWEQAQEEPAGEAIVKVQELIAQLLSGLSPDRSQPLVSRVASIYTFMLRRLAQAHLQRDVHALEDVLRILEIERGTWQQVCQQLGTQSLTPAPTAPHFGAPAVSGVLPGISFEA